MPALESGKRVISDRFTDATYAYQSGGREVSSEKVALLEDFVQGSLRPDMTLLLDAPIEVGMVRARNRGTLDRFEEKKMEFFNKVRNKYLERANLESERFKIVDATQSLDHVHA